MEEEEEEFLLESVEEILVRGEQLVIEREVVVCGRPHEIYVIIH